ncbi:lipase [Actinokineospora diospyrosa]
MTATVLMAVPATASQGVSTPGLSGRYPVGTREVHAVDPGRADPWVPQRRRELMLTVSYPAARAGGPRAPWLPSGVAAAFTQLAASPEFLGLPAGTVDWTSVRRRAVLDAAPARGRWPVVLFSPGFAGPREFYADKVDDLASRGYVVVSMSHTFESAAVQFPDGRVEYGRADVGNGADKKKAIDTRVADTRFVLDRLADLSFADTSRIGMAGHSYGGYTTGETMVVDRRVKAGVNIDGALGHGVGQYLPGRVVTEGLDRPFLLFGGDDVDPVTGRELEHSHVDRDLDPSWADFWATQRGWKRDLHLDRSTHFSFTDLQFIVPQVRAHLPAGAQERVIGTVNPTRSVAAQRDYLAGFFDLHLKGWDRHLFAGSSPCHPDTRLIP